MRTAFTVALIKKKVGVINKMHIVWTDEYSYIYLFISCCFLISFSFLPGNAIGFFFCLLFLNFLNSLFI